MSILVRLIEEKNNELLEFDAIKQEREETARKLAILDSKIEAFDKNKVLADIDELTECAIKLGHITIQTEEVEQVEMIDTVQV